MMGSGLQWYGTPEGAATSPVRRRSRRAKFTTSLAYLRRLRRPLSFDVEFMAHRLRTALTLCAKFALHLQPKPELHQKETFRPIVIGSTDVAICRLCDMAIFQHSQL